ncbi:transcription elongation factor GreA [soil metagenome]
MTTDQRLTPAGKLKLEEDLAQLRTVRLPELTRRSQISNEEGDVSDNSEYEELKDELVRVEARIAEIEFNLGHARIVAKEATDGQVGFGSTVTIRDQDGLSETWTLVSSQEQDTRRGTISTESPVGVAMMGKSAGDSFEVRTPAGAIVYTVEKVE